MANDKNGEIPHVDVMTASVVSVDGDVVTLEVKVKLSGSMLEAEESILAALNEAGCLATGKAETHQPATREESRPAPLASRGDRRRIQHRGYHGERRNRNR
jgi:hypothetical protein